jgi:hypothetical protein
VDDVYFGRQPQSRENQVSFSIPFPVAVLEKLFEMVGVVGMVVTFQRRVCKCRKSFKKHNYFVGK